MSGTQVATSEAQPLTIKSPSNSVPDGKNEEDTMVMSPSCRWKRIQRPSRMIHAILIILLIILLLLLLITTGLAVYYGHAYTRCANTPQGGDRHRLKSDKFHDVLFSDRISGEYRRLHAKNVRLPYTVFPRFYNLRLQVHLNSGDPTDFFFNGSSVVKVQCMNSTNELFVHAYSTLNVSVQNIGITRLAPNGSESENISIRNISYNDDLQWYHILLDEKLEENAFYIIRFGAFRAPLTNELKGWYLSSYYEKGVKKYLATSQLQPTDARRVFPCWDEPAFKAQFQVTLLREKPYHSLSNMGLRESIPIDDKWVADVFEPTVNTSTYLLAFVVSQFASLTGKDSKGRNFTVWTRPEKIGEAKYALETGMKIIRFFEEYFEVPYPLEKTDMIAVPDFAAGAMENWGLMIYREATMLWDPRVGTANSQQKVASVISHEIAHQWFGNLVTLNWWDDLWLNEGFASFIECIGVDHVHPEWGMDEQFLLDDMQKVLISDSLATSRPVFQPVYYPNEINEIFDPISYNKGASVLRMMESFMGRDAFRLGLKNYLSKHKFKNTVHDDLWRSLTEAALSVGKQVDVKSVMDTWLLQMNYPIVTVARVGPKLFRFEQAHYLDPPDSKAPKNPSSYGFQWQIPLTYGAPEMTNWDDNEVIWLRNKSMTTELSIKPDSWYIFNIKQAGFYRVHYADSNWELLTKQLIADHKAIPLHSRTQILDDLFSLANRGNVSYTVFLNLTKYLRKEDSYVAWETARRALAFVQRMLAVDSSYGLFSAYLRGLVDEQIRLIDWTTMQEDTNHMQHMLRWTIAKFACKTNHYLCVNKAKELYNNWMTNKTGNLIPPSLRATIYCSAIQWGGQREWQFLWDRLSEEKREEELVNMRTALACTRDMWIMKSFVKKMFSSLSDPTDLVDVITYLTYNPLGHVVLWDYIREAWRQTIDDKTNDTTKGLTPMPPVNAILKILSKKHYTLNNIPLSEEILALEHASQGTTESSILQRSFQELFRRNEQNMVWTKKHLHAINKWLEEHVSDRNALT
ncbi:Glutamyl aminopeptidase [Fasciola hepatica]|uniref:Glutamyl aminopeptidase n=1 Tax=Fasciola hepatica TaxID=6192 RepID=A0A4E0RKJ9_FASHE|nr:Glutamyl aminopeptidase [Fasciola hepatica]